MSKDAALVVLLISFILYIIYVGCRVCRLYQEDIKRGGNVILYAIIFSIEMMFSSLIYGLAVITFGGIYIW